MLKIRMARRLVVSKPGNVWRRVHGKITKRPTNFSWLIEKELAGSGMPTSLDEFEWIRGQGVDSVVTMTEDPLPDEWTRKIAYLHVPTPDLTAPGMDDIDAAVEFVHDQIRNDRSVMVHCAAGMGRAGTILACYFVKYRNLSATAAIEKIRNERPGSIQSEAQELAVGFYQRHIGKS